MDVKLYEKLVKKQQQKIYGVSSNVNIANIILLILVSIVGISVLYFIFTKWR